jgi:hypothetical protein
MVVAVLSLQACERPPRSASYFQTHDADRHSALADCKAGQLRGRECDTAAQAEAQATSGRAESEFRARLKDK